MNIKRLMSLLLFVVSIAMIGSGIYIMNSSKYMFETVLTKALNYLVEGTSDNPLLLDGMDDYDKYKFTTNTNINVQSINLASLTGDLFIDNNKFYLDIDTKIADKDFVGLETLMEDNKVYLKLKEAMDKFYYVDLSEESGVELSETSSFDKKDIKLLSNHLKKSILQDLTDDDFEKESKELNLGGKTYKTSRISLKLSEKDTYKIMINLLENIKGDAKAIQVIQKYDKNITADTLKEEIKELEEAYELASEEEIEFSFYVKGVATIVRVELTTLNSEVDSVAEDNSSITVDVYTNSKDNKVLDIKLMQNQLAILTITEEKTSDSSSYLGLVVNDGEGTVSLTGTYNKTSNNIKLYFDMLMDNENLGNFTYNVNETTKNKEYKVEIVASLSDNIINITSVNSIFVDESIPSIDINGAANFDDMTDSEAEKIYTYIQDKLEETGLDNYVATFGGTGYEDDASKDGYSTSYYEEISAEDVEELINSEEPVVIWFGSQDCRYCVEFAQVLEESYWDYYYDINYINIDDLTSSDRDILNSLDSRLNVYSTPTTVVLQNGKVKDIHEGVMTKDVYYNFLDSNGVE